MNKEVVIIMGYNAAGKSTLVQEFVNKGYQRLNRDNSNSTLEKMAIQVLVLLDKGVEKIVLDNTYPTIASRKMVLDAARPYNVPVRCIHLTTSMEDAQLNACLRMMRKVGNILQPEDFKKIKDPNLFPPAAIYAYRKAFQKPTMKEGFSVIEEVPFVRTWGPDYINKALILDYDGTLRRSTGKQKFPTRPSEICILPKRSEILKTFAGNYLLLGASNQSGVAKGELTIDQANECFVATNEMLGVNIDFMFCPHNVPPISCFCRKPAPGIGARFIEKYKLRPSECIMVGDVGSDKTFASRCGFRYIDASVFFK
jgi:HAD superfamily hydrolase (TIGR01662 family)